MSVTSFIEKATARGVRLTVQGGQLSYTAPTGVVTQAVLDYMRQHKAEIIDALTPPPPPLAVLLRMPDGRRFWLAPDGFQFDHGGLPILRRSVMDKLVAAGADVATEVKHLIDVASELGGELSMKQETTTQQQEKQA